MRIKIVLAAAVMMMVLVGCTTSKLTSGVVGWHKEFTAGSFAPDIPFISKDGKQTTFHNVRQPIAFLAFIDPDDGECCSLRPELISLSKQFRVLPITVVQISLPTKKCPHGSGCMEVGNLDKADMVMLCDPYRIAWRAYGQPKPNTVILVDKNNKLIDIGSFDNLKALVNKAEQMAYAVDIQRFGIIGD